MLNCWFLHLIIRKENREKAMHLLREGRRDEAFKYFQTSIDITPEMARNVIAAARERNIDCIVAPYEADAQLAYLNMCGLIDYIITEDSDLCLFGCQKVLFKLKETGDCILYDRSELGKVFGNFFSNCPGPSKNILKKSAHSNII